jgi:hypothetical protein
MLVEFKVLLVEFDAAPVMFDRVALPAEPLRSTALQVNAKNRRVNPITTIFDLSKIFTLLRDGFSAIREKDFPLRDS